MNKIIFDPDEEVARIYEKAYASSREQWEKLWEGRKDKDSAYYLMTEMTQEEFEERSKTKKVLQ